MNVANFDRQIREKQRKVVAEATETIRAVGLELYRSLVQWTITVPNYGSPVASGRFAASMRLSLNTIDTTTAPADPNFRYDREKDASGSSRTIRNVPLSRVQARLRTFKLGDKIIVANSVPYVRRIEIGRHSWQAPGGVFGPTVEKVALQFKNINLRVRYV